MTDKCRRPGCNHDAVQHGCCSQICWAIQSEVDAATAELRAEVEDWKKKANDLVAALAHYQCGGEGPPPTHDEAMRLKDAIERGEA